jgi:ubiquinone/menaquinone biosynthesis C-methylase UbiE
MLTTRARYQRIAPFYDLLDLPFEYARYRHIRPLIFAGLGGRILEAGVGTGRNFPFYPPAVRIAAIDLSPAMLARAARRLPQAAAPVALAQMDATRLAFPDNTFDAAISTFLFCVLPDELQVTALRELNRVVKPGGIVRLLEYTRPQGAVRAAVAQLWEPWMNFAYGAGFDRRTEQHVPEAGLEVVRTRFVSADIIKLIEARAA